MPKSIMIQGTGSGVGKSLIAAGLCRILTADLGLAVAPFKAQNMALNSFVTADGGEIGCAQATQAEAAGCSPSVYMNPILLKASGESGSQIIVLGKVYKTMQAAEFYEHKELFWKTVTHAWDELSAAYEFIVIEGAGSPAEINLMDREIVNMAVARHTGSPVLLVGDIDRGGVFASLYGTTALLNYDDSRLIKAFIINKFRGDINILLPGNKLIEDRTGIPVIGVLPYVTDMGLPEEDGLVLDTKGKGRAASSSFGSIKITVLRLKYISNFTDFQPFQYEPDVELIISQRPEDIINTDLIIIPGSKNTIADLLILRDSGLDEIIKQAVKGGTPVIGLCGGYQMLGRTIEDPLRIESTEAKVVGLCLLDTTTVFNKIKTTRQVIAATAGQIPHIRNTHSALTGYEIHMGQTEGSDTPAFVVHGNKCPDGAVKGGVWGTYIHGIFDNDAFRRDLVNGLRERKGLPPIENAPVSYAAEKDAAIDRLAQLLRTNLNMDFIYSLAGL
ncbi:cobyric acid synthase [Candidatus Magnetominusculus dajiuhuensis]|uniref:cobyric acid synthase n=1 Tax=Candidatus Magnetominusculus dajiuhuensis TaxID=3137712 RepID=UPI003B42A95E